MKINRLLAPAFIFVMMFVGASPVFAQEQSSATLEETADFLSGMSGLLIYREYPSNKLRKDAAGSPTCEAYHSFKFGTENRDGDQLGYLLGWTFKLGDIDPLSIKVVPKKIALDNLYDDPRLRVVAADVTESSYYVYLGTTSGRKSVKFEVLNFVQNRDKGKWEKTNIREYMDNSVHFWMTDKEKAERMVRALKHAVKLCGGKVDPF